MGMDWYKRALIDAAEAAFISFGAILVASNGLDQIDRQHAIFGAFSGFVGSLMFSLRKKNDVVIKERRCADDPNCTDRRRVGDE